VHLIIGSNTICTRWVFSSATWFLCPLVSWLLVVLTMHSSSALILHFLHGSSPRPPFFQDFSIKRSWAQNFSDAAYAIQVLPNDIANITAIPMSIFISVRNTSSSQVFSVTWIWSSGTKPVWTWCCHGLRSSVWFVQLICRSMVCPKGSPVVLPSLQLIGAWSTWTLPCRVGSSKKNETWIRISRAWGAFYPSVNFVLVVTSIIRCGSTNICLIPKEVRAISVTSLPHSGRWLYGQV